MTPNESEIQVAVEAAARDLFARQTAPLRVRVAAEGGPADAVPTWEELDPMHRHNFLDQVQPVVWAALQALPDRLDSIRLALLDDPEPQAFVDWLKRWLAA